jgi:hypothetical protein
MYKNLIVLVALIAFTATYVSAECNNMCSGHGICSANDACVCYRNWRGNDCSERTCQYGVAFVDTAQGDLDHDGAVEFFGNTANYIKTQWAPYNSGGTFEQYPEFKSDQEAHSYMECSNKGLCDRVSGECVCFDGYEGSACQRTVCPNSCSGHGVCRNIVDISKALTDNHDTDYLLWDGLKNQACVCDPGYSGVDCGERLCPRGHDPLNDEEYDTNTSNWVDRVDEIQRIIVEDGNGDAAFAFAGTDYFTLSYTDVFGEVWTTVKIYPGDGTTLSADVEAALTGIPNSVIESVDMGTDTSYTTGGGGNDHVEITITFTKNAGDLVLLTASSSFTAGTIAVDQKTEGSKIASECSGRGLCDYETGVCKCFRGYRLDDCSSQHALAFNSA